MDVQKNVNVIANMKRDNIFPNYIEYIQFPFFKNMQKNTKINFSYPLTVLVGRNGSGKSSVLHALYGAPENKSCADFWFSTEVDPIRESDEPNRFFYGYREDKKSEIKEVMKRRIRRGSATKKDDPDYWETSKPVKRDGMEKTTRFSPVKKEVIYFNFRNEISAFDQIFYFSKYKKDERKDLLRKRSKYLSRLFNGEAMRFPGQDDLKVGSMYELSPTEIKIISKILGKRYVSIKIAKHKLYRIEGVSIYVKTNTSSNYSEANAGSGETAIIELVDKIEGASNNALILLDEPEISIHPSAQERLQEYLLEIIKTRKMQIIISTHSPYLVQNLPNSAIKLFDMNADGQFFVRENVNYKEAFFILEDYVVDKHVIICEDIAAKILLEKVLVSINKEQYFKIQFFSGGEKSIIQRFVPAHCCELQDEHSVFLFLDGDMKPRENICINDLTNSQTNDCNYLKKCVKAMYGMDIRPFVDSGSGEKHINQECDEYINYLRFFQSNIAFLPNEKIPEVILLESDFCKKEYSEIIKDVEVTNLNAKEVVKSISEFEFGDSNKSDIEATIKKLAQQWVKEESDDKRDIIANLTNIFNEGSVKRKDYATV